MKPGFLISKKVRDAGLVPQFMPNVQISHSRPSLWTSGQVLGLFNDLNYSDIYYLPVDEEETEI